MTLSLPEGAIELQSWLRVLPNRRYVASAAWRGRRVLAKLIVGRKAGRHYRRERAGVALLSAQHVPAPQLLATGYSHGAGGWLLFEYLEHAESLGSSWQAVAGQEPLSDAQLAILGRALEALGCLHGKGLWQEDLHLDNLLCRDGALYWVDAGSIRGAAPGRPLAAAQALANLGVFFAQLPACYEPFVPQLLDFYRRGGGRPDWPVAELTRHIARARQRRLDDYLAKLGRDCSQFSVQRGPSGLRAVLRSEVGSLRPLLADPDGVLARGEILKDGGSATVAVVTLNGRKLLIKRYNIKGLSHWLRRFWRPSRAWRSWREGHRLRHLGVATPLPLAVLERRCCWLRGRAYLVTEFVAGDSILTRFAPHVNGAPPAAELAAVERLFAALNREKISHGDMKGSNLLWSGDGWSLVDLDAVRQHRGRRSFLPAGARDRARFLRNWPTDSALFRLLDERIPDVSGPSFIQRG